MFAFPETARAVEMVAVGLALPIAVYMTLPAYRQFCSEPDPDDLKNSAPKRKRFMIAVCPICIVPIEMRVRLVMGKKFGWEM